MTYVFKISFKIDSDIPGDYGDREKIVNVEEESEDSAFEYVCDKYNSPDYLSFGVEKI